MEDSALQARLYRIELRQYLILALLLGGYLVGIADVVGLWMAGVLGTGFGVAVFGVILVSRRRNRTTTAQ